MIDPDIYKEWTNASWPDSYYEGKWEKDGKKQNSSRKTEWNVCSMMVFPMLLRNCKKYVNDNNNHNNNSIFTSAVLKGASITSTCLKPNFS